MNCLWPLHLDTTEKTKQAVKACEKPTKDFKLFPVRVLKWRGKSWLVFPSPVFFLNAKPLCMSDELIRI